MKKFNSKEEYSAWVKSQDWYQTIELNNGLKTQGKFPTQKRDHIMSTIDFAGKSVLDVGCNSGQYCLQAKRKGASRVVGVDIDQKRIEQAKTLALNENLDVEFLNKGITEISSLGKFDVVLCVAVLTEIPNFFQALDALKSVIGKYAFIELSLAKPLLYVSTSRGWIKGSSKVPRMKSLAEFRQTKRGDFVLDPTLEVFTALLGNGYKVRHLGKGIRYDMVEVVVSG